MENDSPQTSIPTPAGTVPTLQTQPPQQHHSVKLYILLGLAFIILVALATVYRHRNTAITSQDTAQSTEALEPVFYETSDVAELMQVINDASTIQQLQDSLNVKLESIAQERTKSLPDTRPRPPKLLLIEDSLIAQGLTYSDVNFLTNQDMEDVKRFSRIFVQEYYKYPVQWANFKRPGLIILTGAEELSDQYQDDSVAVAQAGLLHALFNIGELTAYEDDYIARAIHHEFMHSFDTDSYVVASFDDKELTRAKYHSRWAELNQDGNNSYLGFDANIDPSYSQVHPETGFITGYAMTDPAEDRAEVMAFIMTNDYGQKLTTLMKEDKILADKVDMLINDISESLKSKVSLDTYFSEFSR